jgi:cell division septation protein DedD
LQFSVSVSIVVVLLAVASLTGYHIGRIEAERGIKESSGEKADFSVGSDSVPSRTDTPAPVTFYTVLTEPRDETPAPPQPKTAPEDDTDKPSGTIQAKDDLSLILQVASYKRRESAADLLKKLSAEGYSGTVQVADLGERGTWYRVHVGPVRSEKEAKEVLDKLRKERDLKGYIVR